MNFTEQQLQSLLRRDWAVRVLDAWAIARVANVPAPVCGPKDDGGLWWGVPLGNAPFADSPDAARLAAAEAVWFELPESVRAELGERP